MLTERQASDVWCPFARLPWFFERAESAIAGVSYNRTGTGEPVDEARCLAARCAAWRWTDPEVTDEPREEWTGFCGLAGRP